MKKRLGFDLILLGDPTAGKDTHARILMKEYALKPVESGKHWRKVFRAKTKEGAWLRRTFALGHPAPVALMKKFLLDNLKKISGKQDFIFVGNPRLKPEAQMLAKMLKQKNRDFFVLYIKLPAAQVYKRSGQRIRTEKEGHGQYIKNRIDWHKNQVSKTVKYFQSLNKLKFVSGVPPINQVSRQIDKLINDYKRSKRN